MEAVVPTPLRNVVINEFLAHTDPPEIDYLELYNHSNTAVDLSGCWLSDDPSTNKFRIPDGTTIAARGFVYFDANQLGFNLNAAGRTFTSAIPSLPASWMPFVLARRKTAFRSDVRRTGRPPSADLATRRRVRPMPRGGGRVWS